jgi:hypothetical protein
MRPGLFASFAARSNGRSRVAHSKKPGNENNKNKAAIASTENPVAKRCSTITPAPENDMRLRDFCDSARWPRTTN